ncbi:VQ motif-containing protein [Melia azedarach]|uniref:VQ motif-containing protein n=2 Tax=Melia azedarach TaxID=155640 RepID=A0ACC1YTF8_MELAZ|nr:VQ motif-containing protein [Melia azedarach]KAJ4726329.1 VQ motif-containing protein [Melia azedarach]
MEITTRVQEGNNISPLNSPRIASCSNSIVSSGNSNGVQIHTPPLTPIPISRSTETNPYPTTFVQADTTNFKQVVQMLTGSSETAKQASSSSSKPPAPSDPSLPPPNTSNNKSNFVIPPIKTTTPKKQNFKLYERRANNFKNSLMINTLLPTLANNSSFSPRNMPEILSPSLLDFPKLALSSPVTPLNEDPFNKSSPSLGNSSSEEERAIAEKGFYFHPSPISTPRDHEPQLLPLFPLTSPRVSGSSS